jgi:hypothetical protein
VNFAGELLEEVLLVTVSAFRDIIGGDYWAEVIRPPPRAPRARPCRVPAARMSRFATAVPHASGSGSGRVSGLSRDTRFPRRRTEGAQLGAGGADPRATRREKQAD